MSKNHFFFSAFVRLSEAEVSLMKAILPEDDFKKVFDLIVNIPLDSIKQDAGRFVRHCKECKGKFSTKDSGRVRWTR